jgi:hypothetical protein
MNRAFRLRFATPDKSPKAGMNRAFGAQGIHGIYAWALSPHRWRFISPRQLHFGFIFSPFALNPSPVFTLWRLRYARNIRPVFSTTPLV